MKKFKDYINEKQDLIDFLKDQKGYESHEIKKDKDLIIFNNKSSAISAMRKANGARYETDELNRISGVEEILTIKK